MLNVAHGELPAEAACIYDVPIESIALPDPSDRYYSSALVKRLEIQTRNQSNRARRLTIVFNTRTRLFGMLIRSVKTKNPGFAQEMQEQCMMTALGARHSIFVGRRAVAPGLGTGGYTPHGTAEGAYDA